MKNLKNQVIERFVVLGGCLNRPFSKKAQNLCDVTQYAYAESQVTKHIYTLAMNLVTLKCQYLNGNNSVISASVMMFFTILE
jgi:hypothetical protein